MSPLPPPSTLAFAASLLLLAGYLLYRATIPKPIPGGIPYVAASAVRAFGDVPDAIKHHAKTGEMIAFLATKCVELNSPIVQVFLRPFSKPWVVIADSQESQDIMARRTREFDRSDYFGDLLKATIPHHQVWMRTGEQWRSNRRLMADTMAPQFLQNVAGPQIHAQFCSLIRLWRTKVSLAQGHPFSASLDIEGAMFDGIWAAAFGSTIGSTETQVRLLGRLSRLDGLSQDNDAVAVFPEAPYPPMKSAMSTIANSSEIPTNSPLGRRHHEFALKYYPSIRKAVKLKNQMVEEKLHAAWQKFSSPGASEDSIKCAADLIVAREVTLARKENRQPQHDSPTVQDELFGFLLAGYDTTSTTIEWGVKYLTAHQDVQAKLRQHLRATFSQAAEQKQPPSAVDIAKTSLPYLDAVIEEILRCGATAPATVRVATEDTEVFGHHIPKGTDVFMLNMGPSYTAPPFPIDEAKRSTTSKLLPTQDRWTGTWDPRTLGDFDPERWLVRKSDAAAGEQQTLDPQAGPMQTFGGGLRGCFGKKLARLNLRIVFTLMLWDFELRPLPQALGDFRAKDVLTHRPQQVHLRLQECAP
ncbi:hypothetical protein LTR36_004931 [Oleoguttula mirabilis]|uniref:Cytochrome P450 n=1 Tax=Oleoguttula mirabilis TaxID=1507867 RepID=A0AAV9JVJ5_9PEZI|nr:hypothetical protein LTR36_004931 [Oleoguttula mirabilis]